MVRISDSGPQRFGADRRQKISNKMDNALKIFHYLIYFLVAYKIFGDLQLIGAKSPPKSTLEA